MRPHKFVEEGYHRAIEEGYSLRMPWLIYQFVLHYVEITGLDSMQVRAQLQWFFGLNLD
jgi:hypothetical protein